MCIIKLRLNESCSSDPGPPMMIQDNAIIPVIMLWKIVTIMARSLAFAFRLRRSFTGSGCSLALAVQPERLERRNALGGLEGCWVTIIVRRAGLLWSQQDFEWRLSVPLFKCLTVLEFSFILICVY